jgi:kumamolisin
MRLRKLSALLVVFAGLAGLAASDSPPPKAAPAPAPKLKPHYRRPTIRAHVSGTTYNPPAVARRYDFPNGVTGRGATVGVIELGGAYNASDLATYQAGLGLPVPSVTVVPVDGATPTSDGVNGADGEVMLDIEVIASVAPGAAVRVYFAANTTAAFLDAFKQARADGCMIVSCSWGGPENTWSAADLAAFNAEFQAGAAAGVNYFCAAGDNGSGDGEGGLHVDFPGSSPWVICCGGTSLPLSGSETVWNDGSQGGATGGGVSTTFARPSWQPASIGGKRGVPDVAGDADPNTGYTTLVDGTVGTIGGTSAVAPLYAAAAALFREQAGKYPGFLGPQLYGVANPYAAGFVDITSGNNGFYHARAGYDFCTGIGRVDGAKLYASLTGAAPVTPPPPPPSAGGNLFTLSFSKPIQKGARVTFTAPVAIPAGSYQVAPAAAGASAVAE